MGLPLVPGLQYRRRPSQYACAYFSFRAAVKKTITYTFFTTTLIHYFRFNGMYKMRKVPVTITDTKGTTVTNQT